MCKMKRRVIMSEKYFFVFSDNKTEYKLNYTLESFITILFNFFEISLPAELVVKKREI